MPRPTILIERTCNACGEVFLARPKQINQGRGKFCSRKCFAANLKVHPNLPNALNPKIARTCQVCGRAFQATATTVKESGANFCSRECWRQSLVKPLSRQFLAHVSEPDDNGCMIWTGTVTSTGYGRMRCTKDKRSDGFVQAHRYAFMLANGEIPAGMEICHSCDVPLCCSPLHLFLGSHQDNMADMTAKGRRCKGEKHPTSKLTEDAVRSIRARYKPRVVTLQQLADEYGVSLSNINGIILRRIWKHLS